MNTQSETSPLRRRATIEVATLSCLLFLGLAILPIAVYIVGQTVFGDYAGSGYGDFFGRMTEKVRHWDPVAWFLILSPYLVWQLVRLAAFAWRRTKGAR